MNAPDNSKIAEEVAKFKAERAQAAIVAMKERYVRTGRFGADAAALQDVPPMLDFYDALIEHGSPQIMTDALAETVIRMNMQRAEGTP